MISHLLKYSNTQFTLTVQKTTKDLLKDEIQRRMGRCMRVSEFFKNAFYSTFVLGTYTNPRFSSISEYFHSVLYQKVMFPEYSINDYIIFSSRNDFIRYVQFIKKKSISEMNIIAISGTLRRESTTTKSRTARTI